MGASTTKTHSIQQSRWSSRAARHDLCALHSSTGSETKSKASASQSFPCLSILAGSRTRNTVSLGVSSTERQELPSGPISSTNSTLEALAILVVQRTTYSLAFPFHQPPPRRKASTTK